MGFYRIANMDSGEDLGIYKANNEEEAIQAMLEDAGTSEDPSPDLHVVECYSSQSRLGMIFLIKELLGADSTTEDARLVLEECERKDFAREQWCCWFLSKYADLAAIAAKVL